MHPAFSAIRVADAAPEFEFAHNFHRQFAALIGPFNGKAGARAASHIHLIGTECGKARQRQAGDGTGGRGAFRRRGCGRGRGLGRFGAGGGRSAGGGTRCRTGGGASGSAIALACLRLLAGRALLLTTLALLRLLLASRALLLLRGRALLALGIALRRLRPWRRIDHGWARFRTLGRGRRPSRGGRRGGLARRRHILRPAEARLPKGRRGKHQGT